MEQNNTEIQLSQPESGQIGVFQNSDALMQFRTAMQNFTKKINELPEQGSVDKTADGKAGTILISHIQMLLDEYFFGLWSESDLKWQQIGNEIVGSMLLTVIHPVWGKEVTRVGAAAITIMVDAVPEHLKWQNGDGPEVTEQKKKDRNTWALDMQNKKSNALDMSFPKLKTECLKNAANSFGKLFGRDLNRKKQDTYAPLMKNIPNIDDLLMLFELKKEALTPDDLVNANRIITNKEVNNYSKLYKTLQTL